ncbi:MAG: ABC transporter permease [Spirochaetes bacterium]|nr:ABC transporter permease [Spirochaetota bacterium]
MKKNRLQGFVRSERFVETLPYFLVVILFLLFTGLYPSFANIRNITGILTVSTVFLLVAAGETFPILMGSIDLSIGTMLSSSSIVAAYLFPYGGPWMILVAVAMGLISGIVNGSLIVALRLPSFIVTLAMMFAYRGIATSITSGYNINIRSRSFSWISTGEIIPGIPNIIIWGVIVFIIFLIISKRTKIGRYIYAIGGNEDAVKRMGINVDKYRIIAFAFSGLLNGVACVLLSSYLGMAPARLGDKYLFNGLTAVIVGGTSIFGGIGGLMRTLIGVLLIGVFDNGMNLIGVDSRGQDIAKGVLLIIAVSVTILSQKRGKIILTK